VTSVNLKVVVVDDESAARTGLAALVRARPDCTLVGECRDGVSALHAIEAGRPDVVLLYLQMRGMDGFEVVRRLPARGRPLVIFVTAHDEYAIRAFDAVALDYLLKPFSDARFHRAMDRARSAVASRESLRALRRDAARVAEHAAQTPRIAIQSGTSTVYLTASEIDWIEGAGYRAIVHAAGKEFVVRRTLTSLDRQLRGSVCTRIHRSVIVNTTRVRALRAYHRNSYVAVLIDGTRVPVSRSRRAVVRAALSETRG
jgi:two-component system LytT family response regulator